MDNLAHFQMLKLLKSYLAVVAQFYKLPKYVVILNQF